MEKSDSSKDSPTPELIEELNRDLLEKIKELQLKEDTITHLESDIQSSKAEIESLNEKLNSLSHLQQVQVSTEITSIQYEEQFDKLENEKKLLLEEKDRISKEYEELQEKLEMFQKEKQELVVKLENYEQENMELMEKLEKLSTEKVSSAESIEIVEGLTQQEKLELEQYQKNLDMVSGNLKVSDESLMPSPDLNESVNQLTEETSELLQKIELFTVERREVMEKMEVLTNENNNLTLRIKEIENNRDVLAETYEQLQNEKECLDNKIEGLEKDNDELKSKLTSSESEVESLRRKVASSESDLEPLEEGGASDLSSKLITLEKQYNELLEENKNLQAELKQSSEFIHEKDSIENELREARQTINEMERKIQGNLEEINNYQTLIEDNKNELINSAETINRLQNKLEDTENELQVHKNEVAHLNSIIADLNNAVMNLECENKTNVENSSSVENQLSELKAALNDHIHQAEEYEKELEHNSEVINNLNKELKTLKNRIIETEHLLDSKDDEIKKLTKERDNKEIIINNLQEAIKQKDEAFHKLRDELKEKYLTMQKQMEANSGSLEDIKVPLQNTIEELTAKNKEQLEKMKKIAANLKKKNHAYQELEQKFKAQEEAYAMKVQEYEDLERRFMEQTVSLDRLSKENDEKQQSSVEKEIQQVNLQKAELNTIISELADTESLMSESLRDEMSFHSSAVPPSEQLDVSYLRAKIQEVKAIRQRQHNKILEYEEHIARLEDNAASAEQVQAELQRQISDLNTQLEEKNNKLMEMAEAENILLEKLAHLTSQYETNERSLMELNQKKEKLFIENNNLKEQNEKLKQKINVAQEKVHELSSYGDNIALKDQENEMLHKQNQHLENEIKHLQTELERLTQEHRKELETMDADWQQQSNEWLKEKTDLNVQIEKLNEQFTELMEKTVTLRDDLAECRSKLEEKEQELDKIKSESQMNINTIDQMSRQNSSLQEENENLKMNLNVISNQMVTYQQQSNQLQAENASLVNQLMTVSSSQNNEVAILYNELNRQLEETTNEKQQLIVQLQEVNSHAQQTRDELEVTKRKLQDSQREITMLRSKIQLLKNDTLKEAVVQTVDDVLNQAQEAVSFISVASNQGAKSTQIQAQETVPSKPKEEYKMTTITAENIIDVPTFSWPQTPVNENIQCRGEEPIPLFSKPLFDTTESSDPFAFVSQTVPSETAAYFAQEAPVQKVQDNVPTYNQEELLSKINSLEIMLNNVEKEKNAAIIRCNDLYQEIARLSNEKQSTLHPTSSEPPAAVLDVFDAASIQKGVPPSIGLDLEAQIVSDLDIQKAQAATKELHDLEFQPAKPCVGPCQDEVTEDPSRSESAYLCYTKDATDAPHVAVEAQIVSDLDIQRAQAAKKELRDLEFVPTKPCVGPCQDEVTEDPSRSDSAYLCYKKDVTDAQHVAVDPFAEDDGWGFGPEEAKIEARHVKKPEMLPFGSNALVEELQEKIRALELEKQNHLEEMKQQQIKSGKLIKKLKELKQKNEQLNLQAKKSDDFFSLDDTIQEELKSQIEKLEKKIKELSTELNKEKTEKASIAKRVEVLTAANERMIEMKEKQDIELLCWQRKNQELSDKLQHLEWGGDGFGVSEHKKEIKSEFAEKPTESNIYDLQKRVEELDKIVKDLTLDKEELQALLDEQTSLRIEAEKTNKTMPQTDYLDLISEKNDLNERYKMTLEEKKQLQDTYNTLVKENDNHQKMLHDIEETNNKLNQLVSEKDSLIQELNTKLQALEIENDQLISQTISNVHNANIQGQLNSVVQEKESILKELEGTKQELHKILDEKNEVIIMLQNKESSLDELQRKFEYLENENIRLHSAVEGSNIQEEYKTKLEMIMEEKETLDRQIREKDQEIQTLSESLNSQMMTLRGDLDKQIKTTEDLIEQNKSLSESLTQRNNEYEQLSQQLTSKDAEINLMIEHLTREWETRVDQRGADVAESWKLHLETRESEFSQVEQLLRREINELEEKCNALVNENNELRKNVDAEIKNEVDRIAALQKQINDRQQTISELSQTLQHKQEEIDRLQFEISNYETQLQQLKQTLKEKDDVIMKHAAGEEAIRYEINEHQEIIKGIILKLQEKSPFMSAQKDSILEELDKLIKECNEKETKLQELREKLTETIPSNELLKKEDELRNMNIILEENKTKLAELEIKYTHLENEVETKSMELTSLNAKVLEAENAKKLESEKANMLEQSLLEYQQQYSTLNYELQEKMSSLEQLTNELQSCRDMLQQREEEIQNLKALLEEKEQTIISMTDSMNAQSSALINDYTQEINNLKKRLSENEMHYEEFISAKDHDIETFKIQIEGLSRMLQENETALSSKDATIDELNQKINEQNVLIDDEHKQLTELRGIIEDQVMKIEELKQQLFAKSNDYDSLIAQMETIMTPPTRELSTPVQSSHQEQVPSSSTQQEEEDLTEPVSRAEHDLALYMLHQRDVRCEELTVELTQLLEERDTLQLRLSNAIREKEELRRRYQADTSVSEDEAAEAKSSASPKSPGHRSKTTAIVLGATGTEMATEATEHLPEESETLLANKLSELRTVSHRKDKTIVDEQELRRMQQFSFMQQHRDVASKLPPEAAARLVDATYTLSRDVQSPSKVLLNWLWGRSTPKVNNI